jgi:hypothetical protein
VRYKARGYVIHIREQIKAAATPQMLFASINTNADAAAMQKRVNADIILPSEICKRSAALKMAASTKG